MTPPADPPESQGEDFASLLAASDLSATRRRLSPGDVVSGRVIAIDAAAIFVAVGAKGEATIDPAEFRDADTGELGVAVGDTIEATVVDDGTRSGGVVLRRVLGRGGHVSAELEQALEHRVPIEGLVAAEVKGGYEVRFGAVRAFCPFSQMFYRSGRRGPDGGASEVVGQRFPFRVVKVEQGGRNVVVSRRELLEEQAAAEAASTWQRLRVGARLAGTVTAVADFGAFVDLGGVEGMVHVSEFGYARVSHPSEAVAVGERVEVAVLSIADRPDAKGRRPIALSMKALASDPWQSVAEKYPAGTCVSGTVRRLEPYGAFIELEPGLEGLAHISKLVRGRRLTHARQAVSEGERVDVSIVGVDVAARRLSLSLVDQEERRAAAAADREKAEEREILETLNRPRSLGTFGDLLATAERAGTKKRR